MMPNYQYPAKEAYRNVQNLTLQIGAFYSKMISFEQIFKYFLVGIRIFLKIVGICIHI